MEYFVWTAPLPPPRSFYGVEIFEKLYSGGGSIVYSGIAYKSIIYKTSI